MAAQRNRSLKQHKLSNKLLLNQWLISLFGIDPFVEHPVDGKWVRPFRKLTDPIRDPRLEGLDSDNLHNFYHHLVGSELFTAADADIVSPQINRDLLLNYEQNIAQHTRAINKNRNRPVVWKYYQWLTLLFVEIYLDRFFGNRERLLDDLNAFVERFNDHHGGYPDVSPYADDDLNKLCLQSATGSGKTLLMHVNLLQYRHYAAKHGKDKELSRVILLTPNERLSEQHIAEFRESGFGFVDKLQVGKPGSLGAVDVTEITKLADQQGPNTIATRSLGDQNLLLVDEGHRGMSSKKGEDEGVWFRRRSELCAKGFTFEYSATFEQAVQASGDANLQDSYAKSIIFDYSYRWFYEDGFGKDYQILNLPTSFDETQSLYMTACLLKFYQQLRIYEEGIQNFKPFNLEKPLWVFVGNTVSTGKMSNDGKAVVTDVALIIQFIADFLHDQSAAEERIQGILTGTGRDTGLLDEGGNDIFAGAFNYLARVMGRGETVTDLRKDILAKLFNHAAGGQLSLTRVKGDSGEIVLRAGVSETPFGLINVGDAKGLCDHVVEVAAQKNTPLNVEDSDFTEAMFDSVKDSTSPINLLIGSKKFVEGWDCWRVSTMGLMHVGRSEGAQIIQLFGRGVRLKGYQWSLKRSGHAHAPRGPEFIKELETLNVFGIRADFMEKFRGFLEEEGLPGNEYRKVITVDINVTDNFGKGLKVLRPKHKTNGGEEYDFKKDGAVPIVGEVPEHMTRVVADWYPRIAAMHSRARNVESNTKNEVNLLQVNHLALLDYDALFFELEQFKRERGWHNLNITKMGIKSLLEKPNWYTLYLPEARLNPANFDDVLLMQQVVSELLKRYCERYYNYSKREYMEPRLELRELTREDENFPQEDYQVIVDGSKKSVIEAIKRLKEDLKNKKDELLQAADLQAINFSKHLFHPLLHVRGGGKITVQPVALNESEYRFVLDLKSWCDENQAREGMELFLIRNMSRGKGVGFFEAGNFHPDFILWVLLDGKQYVTFIEPHGLMHEGPGSEKVQFHKQIRDVEQRLGDPSIILNSFILSRTEYAQLKWGKKQDELEDMNVLFMKDDPNGYIDKLFDRLVSGG